METYDVRSGMTRRARYDIVGDWLTLRFLPGDLCSIECLRPMSDVGMLTVGMNEKERRSYVSLQ